MITLYEVIFNNVYYKIALTCVYRINSEVFITTSGGQKMRRVKFIAIAVCVVTVMLAAAACAEVNQTRRRKPARVNRGEARQGGWEHTAVWLIKELDMTEKEAAAVMPAIRKLTVLRRKEMPGLRRLKALQKDGAASPEKLAAGLKRFRDNLADARMKIMRAEKELVDMKEITPKRELTLTILGILDNGRMRARTPASRQRPKKKGRIY